MDLPKISAVTIFRNVYGMTGYQAEYEGFGKAPVRKGTNFFGGEELSERITFDKDEYIYEVYDNSPRVKGITQSLGFVTSKGRDLTMDPGFQTNRFPINTPRNFNNPIIALGIFRKSQVRGVYAFSYDVANGYTFTNNYPSLSAFDKQ